MRDCSEDDAERMNLSFEPLSTAHFEGLRNALDTVAREKRFLALTQAPPEDECRGFYASIIQNGWCQRVAVLDGKVVGWCDVLPTHGQARAHVGILGVGLIPSVRRRGIGARLMELTIEAAWATGLTRIELTVRADNANAKALYERLGFRVEGRLAGAFRVDGVDYDGYAMALLQADWRPLGAGAGAGAGADADADADADAGAGADADADAGAGAGAGTLPATTPSAEPT